MGRPSGRAATRPSPSAARGCPSTCSRRPGERRLQAILSEVAPGGGSGEETYALPAEVEFVFVLEGDLEVTVGGEVTTLGPGDAFTFSPGTEHGFRSLRTDGTTRVLWVFAPALPVGREPI